MLHLHNGLDNIERGGGVHFHFGCCHQQKLRLKFTEDLRHVDVNHRNWISKNTASNTLVNTFQFCYFVIFDKVFDVHDGERKNIQGIVSSNTSSWGLLFLFFGPNSYESFQINFAKFKPNDPKRFPKLSLSSLSLGVLETFAIEHLFLTLDFIGRLLGRHSARQAILLLLWNNCACSVFGDPIFANNRT